MKSFDNKINPYSELHYGGEDNEGKRKRAKDRIGKYLDKGWYDSWFSAARRVLQEMMPNDKFEAYKKIATVIASDLQIELNRDNIQTSTNRYGEHSWYITFLNPDYNEELANSNPGVNSEEYYYWVEENENNHEYLAVKITDHVTSTLQEYTRDGAYIDKTFFISQDNSKVGIIDTAYNDYADLNYDGQRDIEYYDIDEYIKDEENEV